MELPNVSHDIVIAQAFAAARRIESGCGGNAPMVTAVAHNGDPSCTMPTSIESVPHIVQWNRAPSSDTCSAWTQCLACNFWRERLVESDEKLQDAEARARAAETRSSDADARMKTFNAMAQNLLREATAREKEAEARAQELEGRLQEATARAMQAEAEAQEAEASLQEVGARAQELEAKLWEATARAMEAEARSQEAEANMTETAARAQAVDATSRPPSGNTPLELDTRAAPPEICERRYIVRRYLNLGLGLRVGAWYSYSTLIGKCGGNRVKEAMLESYLANPAFLAERAAVPGLTVGGADGNVQHEFLQVEWLDGSPVVCVTHDEMEPLFKEAKNLQQRFAPPADTQVEIKIDMGRLRCQRGFPAKHGVWILSNPWIGIASFPRIGIAGFAPNCSSLQRALALSRAVAQAVCQSDNVDLTEHTDVPPAFAWAVQEARRNFVRLHAKVPIPELWQQAEKWLIEARWNSRWWKKPEGKVVDIPVVLLRWTHDTIGDRYSDSRQLVHETASVLWKAGATWREKWRELRIPDLDVVIDADCRFWSLSNRRLASLRMLQALVPSQIVAPCKVYLHHDKFNKCRSLSTKNCGLGIDFLSRQERLRGRR